MNKSLVLGTLSALALCLFACGDSEPEEKTGSNSDELNAGCITSIKAAPGSAEWRAELDKCLAEAGQAPAPAPAPAPGGGKPGDDGAPGPGGGKSCSTSVQCINGTCTCGGGANKGKTCDGTTATGASSCSVVCAECK